MANTPTFVNRCLQLEEKDSLEFLSLVIDSYGDALPTLQALASSAHLKQVWLSSPAESEGVGQLCREALIPNTSAEKVRLDLIECSDLGMKHVAAYLETNSTIKHLSLLLNNVGEEGASYLAQALTKSSLRAFSIYATELDLHDRCIGDGGVAAISKALSDPNCPLSSICIAQNSVTNSGVDFIIKALTSNTCITSLDLHSNKIDSEGAAKLASFLTSGHCTLTSLTLDGNFTIGNDGARALAQALCSGDTVAALEFLSLKSCGIGEKGAERFAAVLSQNRTLQQLRLCGNVKVGNNAVELISRGLKRNSTLWKLDLSSCGVGDEGCAHLAEALLENWTLKCLLLHKNEIGDGGIMSLCETLTNKS